MPGVVVMENCAANGARTDHDRNQQVNGASGSSYGSAADAKAEASSKMQAQQEAANAAAAMMNGGEVQNPVPASGAADDAATLVHNRMNDLPPEIKHITEGFIPIHLLLSRQSQQTHNALQETVRQLARMPLPSSSGPIVNGNAGASKAGDEFDTSGESVQKKTAFLDFLQTHRGKWIKALVITNWSRQSADVSKLIDLRSHLMQQTFEYTSVLDHLIELKRSLHFARVPSPDLKTAYQVLSSGAAHWMPDLHYIEPPTLSHDENEQWLEELDISLYNRLNLVDHDKIPWHFRHFEINRGVVTFKVQGEFEVDLTIGDEDAETQFWFIDFRFTFEPSPGDASPRLKFLLEQNVNLVLSEEGLAGCYQVLHEYTLSTKVGELRRQTFELSRTSWANTLLLSNLDRGFCVQYWTNRQLQSSSWLKRTARGTNPPPKVAKSWIIVNVKSPRQVGGEPVEEWRSVLNVVWFRDGKEVKDGVINFDHDSLSADGLLKTIVAKHVGHILTTIYKNLVVAPRFANKEAALTVSISETEPSESTLTMQLSATEKVTLQIEPSSGQFTFHPHTLPTLQGEVKLNTQSVDPAEDGARCLESIRWGYLKDEVTRKGRPMGWMSVPPPLNIDQLREICKIRRDQNCQPICLQRQGVDRTWFVMLMLSQPGDKWVAFQEPSVQPTRTGRKEGIPLAIHGQADLSPAFWDRITSYFGAIIAHNVDQVGLHKEGLKFQMQAQQGRPIPSKLTIPSIVIKLSDILPHAVAKPLPQAGSVAGGGTQPGSQQLSGDSNSRTPAAGDSRSRTPWARDWIEIRYSQTSYGVDESDRSRLSYSAGAIITVIDRAKFSTLKSRLSADVLYSQFKGQFCIRLQAPVGQSMMDKLKVRLESIDRVVACIEAMSRTNNLPVRCESVTLDKVVFTYTDLQKPLQQQQQQAAASGQQLGEGAVTPAPAPTPAAQAPTPAPAGSAAPPHKRYQATLDLSGLKIRIDFGAGSPHNRILDIATNVVNSGPRGLFQLTSMLPFTVAPLVVLDRITANWRELSRKGLGSVLATHRTASWFTLYYILPENASRPRSLRLDITARARCNRLYWYVTRVDPKTGDLVPAMLGPGGAGGGQQQQPQPQQQEQQQQAVASHNPDIFDEKLKKVFMMRTTTAWRGLGNGACMPVDGPLKGLLAVDQCVREAVLGIESSSGSSQPGGGQGQQQQSGTTGVQQQQQQPQQPPQQQQQQQQQQPGAQPNRASQQAGRGAPTPQMGRAAAAQQGGGRGGMANPGGQPLRK